MTTLVLRTPSQPRSRTHSRHRLPAPVEAALWAVWITARITGVGLLVGRLRRFTRHFHPLIGLHRLALRLGLEADRIAQRVSRRLRHWVAGHIAGLSLRGTLTAGVTSILLANLLWLVLR